MIREASAGKNSPPPPSVNVAVAHIRVGSYYEIDSSILRQRWPEKLNSIRVVMVGKITERDVCLRYPSMYSLRSHFDRSRNSKMNRSGSLLPVLDESHVMPSELAGDLLYRRIAPHQVSVNRNSWSFWVSAAASRRNNFSRRETISQPVYNTRLCRAASPLGKCWSELRSRGMIKWGKRFRVRYRSRNKENSRLKEEEEEMCKEETEEDDGNETEHGPEKDDGTRKRKLIESRTERLAQIVVYTRKSVKKFVDRWSIERYKLAERNMLKVMKEFEHGNSILRSEARKLIGDTGLLDHLLKHMAGKVAPGGQDRLRRKHNADGAMEYWLESADLIHIRTEAGVEDPYWTPPPGWKRGDNPSQDPVCAGEIREIRDGGLASLKREFERLASKEEEEELLVMTRPNSCVTSQNDNLMTPAKEMHADLLKKEYKIEDQLLIVAETLRQMEEDMGWLKKTVDESCPRKPDSTETHLLLEDSPNLKTLEEVNEVKRKRNQITESPQNREKGKKHDGQEQQRSPLSLISNTGFRICRPVASFSWPKLPSLADVTDNTASLPSHGPSSTSPSYPVKLLAAKRPLVLPFPFTINSPQIREIRDGLASLKREFERLASKEEEEELLVMTTPNSCVTRQNDNLMTPAKDKYADLLKKKYKIEDQLLIVAETLRVDLIHIRTEAGVEDPYWTPPPGWKLGDNPTQDPVCAGEIREIRGGLASLKREFEKLASKKEEEELLVMTTPNSCVTSQNDNLMTPAKETHADLLKKKIEDQLSIVAETLRQMEAAKEMAAWENCLSQYDKTQWTILVPAGRNVCVDPGEEGIVCITDCSFADENRPDNMMRYEDQRAPCCDLYVGINRTKDEFTVGSLDTINLPHLCLADPRFLTEPFTLGHSGYSTIRFTGYRYSHQPQPQPQPQQVEGAMDQPSWPFSVDISAKIMSMLGGPRFGRAKAVCKMFKNVCQLAAAYENIDLKDFDDADELTALMCMRRCGGRIRSFEIGNYKSNGLNYYYTGITMSPFEYLNGELLTKLGLFSLPLITCEDMRPLFARCHSLIDLEMVYVRRIPVNFVLQRVAEGCRRIERLIYADATDEHANMEITADTVQEFVTRCGRINRLGLRGIFVDDDQLLIMLQGLRKLISLDLSFSRRFRGRFLAQVANANELILEELVLDRCRHIAETQLRAFCTRLIEGGYVHMRELIVRSEATVRNRLLLGFIGRVGLDTLCHYRPEMKVDAEYLVEVEEEEWYDGDPMEVDEEPEEEDYFNYQQYLDDFYNYRDVRQGDPFEVPEEEDTEYDDLDDMELEVEEARHHRRRFIHWERE